MQNRLSQKLLQPRDAITFSEEDNNILKKIKCIIIKQNI
jgi:hypothetical protein